MDVRRLSHLAKLAAFGVARFALSLSLLKVPSNALHIHLPACKLARVQAPPTHLPASLPAHPCLLKAQCMCERPMCTCKRVQL